MSTEQKTFAIESDNTSRLSTSGLILDHVNFPTNTQSQLAWQDILHGIFKWPIWFMLAYQDIKLRYRRSILGPFWITISMAITVYSMGYLYAHLFHMDLASYYPFLVAGMLTWSLISGILVEMTDGYTSYEGLIKQIKLPYTLHIHRIVMRNILVFFHNILVMLPIYVIFHETTKIQLNILMMIPGLLIIYINGITYGTIFALIGARFRDVSQIIKSLIQVIFFITPVMWSPTALNNKKFFIVDYNPFYACIELIRAPMLGSMPTKKVIYMAAFVTILGCVISWKMFMRYRSRIVYWL